MSSFAITTNFRRWSLGAILSASLAPAGYADGLIESNPQWDGAVQLTGHRVSCPCPQQPSDCTPCPPESTAPSKTSPEASQSEAVPGQSSDDNNMLADSGYRSGAAFASNTSSYVDPNGYIDIARIASRVRVRYDDMQGANAPTRAEMLYPTLGNFGGPGPNGPGGGPAGGGDIDMRELATYIEVAWGPTFSIFAEMPIRWVDDVVFDTSDPNFNSGTQAGAGDFRAGFRYGIIAGCDEWLTAQVRAWAPTGDARQALGVGHSSIDVALLYQRRLNHRTTWWGELDDWQTIDAGNGNGAISNVDLDGNVLRYGLGVGYDVWQSCGCRPQTLTGVFEVVGWTVLDGVVTSLDSTAPSFEDATGDTIVNGKYGVRYSWNCGCHQETVYVGYGNNWTDERWYSSIFRLEMTHYF